MSFSAGHTAVTLYDILKCFKFVFESVEWKFVIFFYSSYARKACSIRPRISEATHSLGDHNSLMKVASLLWLYNSQVHVAPLSTRGEELSVVKRIYIWTAIKTQVLYLSLLSSSYTQDCKLICNTVFVIRLISSALLLENLLGWCCWKQKIQVSLDSIPLSLKGQPC